jgi:uncharacterized protein (DUF2147 family)
MKKIITLFIVFLSLNINAQNPIGIWKTIDDKTGEAKSHIEIYQTGNKYFGKIVKLLKSEPTKKCDKCPGTKKGKPLLGMLILENLTAHDDYWKNGTIMDPESGKEYGCSMWFEKNNDKELKVRGKHWTGIFRTQTWYRVN